MRRRITMRRLAKQDFALRGLDLSQIDMLGKRELPTSERHVCAGGSGLHRGSSGCRSISMTDKPAGIANGLTNYGDQDFSLYLRRSFAQSMGYSRAMLAKP